MKYLAILLGFTIHIANLLFSFLVNLRFNSFIFDDPHDTVHSVFIFMRIKSL